MGNRVDLIDQLRALSARVISTKDIIQTEEATKNAMIMPFIQALGYNVFDPLEVTPELVADIGLKKGEKVDYAILRDGQPIILFECKKSGGDLNISHAGQLFRYFHVTAARFGVLTNGLKYRFFTDLEQPNKMDETPFFEFDILDFKDSDVDELKKFAKSSFDIDLILTTANELKYTRAIKNKLADLMANPSEELVRIVAQDLIGSRRFTPALKDQFTSVTRRAFEQLINARINERLKGALQAEPPPLPPSAAEIDARPSEPQVVTTPEELEGFHIIRSIVRGTVDTARIVMRDNQTYCAILLDDNNRKPICRLRFNNTEKLTIGFLNEKKEEERVSLASLDDLYGHADVLRAKVVAYLT